MGTAAVVSVEAVDRSSALEASERILTSLEDSEARLTTWASDSVLLRFERASASEPIRPEPPLDRELRSALECARTTGGAFDPTVRRLTEVWDLRGSGRIPTDHELADARAASGWTRVQVHAGERLASPSGLGWDEGGWAKGAALDRALESVDDLGVRSVLVELGGQIAVRGATLDVGVAHPDRRTEVLGHLQVDSGSVATSGNSERSRSVDGVSVGHLLDPRTGRPARDFGSLTVHAPTGLVADCLATGLWVLGPDAALDFAARRPGVEVLVAESRPDGPPLVRWSGGLEGRWFPVDSTLRSAVPRPSTLGAR